MNKERIAGKLDVIKGQAKRRMARLTSDASLRREGTRDLWRGRAKQSYGVAKQSVGRLGYRGATAAVGLGALALGVLALKRRST